MASETDPSHRGATLNLQRGPPSAFSSYAGSEASVETATASFATDSTIGDVYFRDAPPQYNTSPFLAQVPREQSNTLPSNPSTNTPLPLLQINDGDTLIFINPPPSTITPEIASRRFGPANAPLRVLSDVLLSTGSQVFVQLLSPSMQQRHLNRLVKQKKVFLTGGRLPPGIKYVLDLTPEDEGEKAVEWQEKLWCPDVVLQWRSNLVDYFEDPPSISAQEQIAKNLEDFRQQEWGGERKPTEGEEPSSPRQPLVPPPQLKKDNLPEPYSFGRHVLSLERLIHIIHGSDPLIKSSVDWYTLHCLSVAFGTTDATRDYVARWIFSNSLMIESHPAFILRIAAEAGLATIASDAFAAAVMRAGFDPEETAKIPGAPEAAAALAIRAQNELKDLLAMDWIDQYLPPASDNDRHIYDPFRCSLRSYVSRRMKLSGNLESIDSDPGELDARSVLRNTWVNLQSTHLASENTSLAPAGLDSPTRFDLEQAIVYWNRWELSSEGSGSEVDDLWRDVKLGAPHHPIPSITQQTSIQDRDTDTDTQLENVTYDDATSEIASHSGTELPSANDDVQSVSSTHTINSAMRALKTENINPLARDSNATLVDPPSSSHLDDLEQKSLPQTSTFSDITEDQAKSLLEEVNAFLSDTPEPLKPTITVTNPDFPNSGINTPLWLQQELSTLSELNRPAHFWAVMHHPSHDYTLPAEPRIRCYDCPDMLYFPGPGESLTNFRVHLRNIRHMNRVSTRKLEEARQVNNGPKLPGSDNYNRNSWSPSSRLVTEIPYSLLNIIRLCETYVKSKCAEMTARNIFFEPTLLEEKLACLEESERSFMPVWSGGETVGSTKSASNRGISDQSANDDMSVNVSTVGVGSACTTSTTASTFSTTGSYVDIETPGASSSGSVISISESDDDDTAMSAPGEGDDWVMSDGDDEEYEIDDDIYFS